MAEVTIGGQRLGSGNSRKEELSHYYRSTFNQEQDFKSSLAPGILYPFMCIPMTLGDSMKIDLDAFVRTLPTKGPLFGSYKLQCDIFSIPMRLYQGILHNNPVDIGMNMKNVFFPKLRLEYKADSKRVKGRTEYDWQVAPTALLKYLGLSGIGRKDPRMTGTEWYDRDINAVPVLAYYDIFKNYYSNKQEKNAYVIEPGNAKDEEFGISRVKYNNVDYEPGAIINNLTGNTVLPVTIVGLDLNLENVELSINGTNADGNYTESYSLKNWKEYCIAANGKKNPGITGTPERQDLDPNVYIYLKEIQSALEKNGATNVDITSIQINTSAWIPQTTADIKLTAFPLKNIDIMRQQILSHNELGDTFILGRHGDWRLDSGQDKTGLPYSSLFKIINNEINQNSFEQNGLLVKTYQSDLFNNWVQTEWIEGENGINAITAVNVSDGTLEMDALILAKKVYDMLNRIALSGGTYEDWQEAVYTDGAIRKAETPVYEGGMAAEIMFEEVISNAETEVGGGFQALGSLGGKGTMVGQKGGHNIEINAHEPIFVMGIVSITPRICYTQGNEWYLTELDSFDDLHKPALDQIGFQDLIVEQMAWWDTLVDSHTGELDLTRSSAGKVVAWSNYMTAVDKAFGDFAKQDGKSFMVLARNYEIASNGGVKDVTTYIDPAKFNYAFAYTDLASQNFWVQIHSKVITRRVMSAHQIPNL